MKSRSYLSFVLLWLGLLWATAQAQHVTVNAADYAPNLAPGSMAAAFGANLSKGTEAALSLPLPTVLAGTRVTINGQAAPLFFVSPLQVNYLIPETTLPGPAEVTITRADGTASRETIQARNSAFSIFTFDQSGTGAGAILDGRSWRMGPFNVRTEQGEPTILAVFGTGLGDAGSRTAVNSRVRVFIGGLEARVLYAGPQPNFPGLDQLNCEIPAGVEDHGTLPMIVRIDDQRSNMVMMDVPMTATAMMTMAMGHTPMLGIDSLRVTIRTLSLKTNQGVEVALITVPVMVDLLSFSTSAQLLRFTNLKAGTYVALTAEFTNVAASYNGQPVPIRLQNGLVQQSFREPITIGQNEAVSLRLHINLGDSLRKQADGSYTFDPVIALERVMLGERPELHAFSGSIKSIDRAAKLLRVAMDGDRPMGSGNERVFTVDAAQAAVFNSRGVRQDFNALAVDQRVEISGVLDGRGVIVASVIRIEDANEPRPGEGMAAMVVGTVLAVNRQSQTFDLRLEQTHGNSLAMHASFSGALPPVITVKWNDQTAFFSDGRGPQTAADLATGKRVMVRFAEFKPPFLTSVVRIMDSRAEGVISNVSGLPNSFVIAAHDYERMMGGQMGMGSPMTRTVTVRLTASTRIVSMFGERLQPSSLIVGTQVEVRGEATATDVITADLIVVMGIEVEGSVVPADVNAAALTFKLTPVPGGEKITVKVSDRTMIFLDRSEMRQQPMRASDFFNLISSKPARLEVDGFFSPDAARTILALKIRLDD